MEHGRKNGAQRRARSLSLYEILGLLAISKSSGPNGILKVGKHLVE
jgi:hypothetical protein